MRSVKAKWEADRFFLPARKKRRFGVSRGERVPEVPTGLRLDHDDGRMTHIN